MDSFLFRIIPYCIVEIKNRKCFICTRGWPYWLKYFWRDFLLWIVAINTKTPTSLNKGIGGFVKVAGVRFELTAFRLCIPATAFAASDSRRNLWSGLYLYPEPLVRDIRQLVSTPSSDPLEAWLGITFIRFHRIWRMFTGLLPNRGPNFEPDELPDCSTPPSLLDGLAKHRLPAIYAQNKKSFFLLLLLLLWRRRDDLVNHFAFFNQSHLFAGDFL